MRNRRDRERSRYKRGTAAKTSEQANRAMKNLYGNTCLDLPKDTSMYDPTKSKIPRIDILLYKVGKGNPFADKGSYHYERSYWRHNGIGPNNLFYVCPRKTANKPCPICEEYDRLRDDPEASEKQIRALKPSWRQLFNVVDPNDRSKGVQIWDFSYYLFGELLIDYIEDEETREELKYWNEFEGGKTLRLGLKDTVIGNSKPFPTVKRIDFRDRKKDYDPDKMLKEVHCLDDIIKVPTYEDLKKVFLQIDEGTDGKDKSNFRRSDVQKIKEMSDKQLKRFIIVNDMDVEIDDYEDDPDGLMDAVLAEVEAAVADKSTSRGNEKGKGKKAKDDDDDISVGDTVKWEDEDGDEMKGTVLEIKGKKKKKAVIEDEDDDKFTVPVEDLELLDDDGDDPEGDDEIEVEDDVTWEDDDGEEHEGEVLEIKGKKAVVKSGRKKYTVKLSDLSLQ